MNENERNSLFRRKNDLIYFSPDCEPYPKRKDVEKTIQSLYLPINMYLWLHGIGFTKKVCFKKENCLSTIISLLFLVLFEGNFMYLWYSLIFIKYGEYYYMQNKGNVAYFIVSILNSTMRLLFYTRRNELKDIFEKLSIIYAMVSNEIKEVKILKVKLIILWVINEASAISYMAYNVYKASQYFTEEFTYGFIEYPYAAPICCISIFFSSILLIFGGVTAYFFLVCVLLECLLKEFKVKLQENYELEYLVKIHKKISAIISKINSVVHCYLLATFASILLIIFREGYFVFFLEGADFFNYWNVVFWLCPFMLICMSSSSVTEAAAEVKTTAQYLTFDASKANHLQLFLQVKKGLPGFKILNCIAIDSSLFMTSIGMLLTYGFLVATFNLNNTK